MPTYGVSEILFATIKHLVGERLLVEIAKHRDVIIGYFHVYPNFFKRLPRQKQTFLINHSFAMKNAVYQFTRKIGLRKSMGKGGYQSGSIFK